MSLKKKNPYTVSSITLGIISIFSALFWFISLPTSILAIILGNKGRIRYDSGGSLAGMILGIVGLTMSGIVLLFVIGIVLINYIFNML